MSAKLEPPVQAEVDHLRGPAAARVTLVMFGDFQCPYCREVAPAVEALREGDGDDLLVVFRHLPQPRLHPRSRPAALAAEAAAAQGHFWQMHDRLFERGGLRDRDLRGHARALGLDLERFESDLAGGVHEARVQRDADSAAASGAPSTPAFYVNGELLLDSPTYGPLRAAVAAALG